VTGIRGRYSVTSTCVAITLAGMRFHVRVGVLPHEREIPQPLELDLTVRLAPADTDVLDYRTLYALTREVVEREPLDYLEAIGGEIAMRCLALPSVASVRVAVRKPHVALGGPLSHAEVVVEQDRD
jgi:7,8-dihydroneopterin aldolase/epimerase/oxygenase